jgi:hypothetical protein
MLNSSQLWIQPVYPMPRVEELLDWQPAVREEVKEMLDSGMIEPSGNPWTSPVVCVKKKYRSFRMGVD